MSDENRRGRPPKDRPTPMAQRLHSLRRANGWSQERLAERAGVAVKTVQGIERDDHEPKLLTVICLADALGVTLDYLVRGRGTP